MIFHYLLSTTVHRIQTVEDNCSLKEGGMLRDWLQDWLPLGAACLRQHDDVILPFPFLVVTLFLANKQPLTCYCLSLLLAFPTSSSACSCTSLPLRS
jgi:hypothetical protein